MSERTNGANVLKRAHNQFGSPLLLIRTIFATHLINVQNNANGVQSNQKCAHTHTAYILYVRIPVCVYLTVDFVLSFYCWWIFADFKCAHPNNNNNK